MTLADSLLWMAGAVAEAVVLFLLIRRRVFSSLPVFTSYIAWSLLSDLAQYAAANYYHAAIFRLYIYVVSLAIDSLFQFGVLIELSRSVLRPMAKLLPSWTPIVVGVLIALICAAIWPFASVPGFSLLPRNGRILIHLQQTFSILRILFFLVLAGCSQLLSIGWRDRELQIATGLGFFSMVSLSASILHTHQVPGAQYHLLDQIVAASYSCCLLYWAYCFARQEAERREFTPQMQNFLLAMAGTARTTRIALADSAAQRSRDRRK
ncbi:MAG TPA: hypothetical protein VMQ56_16045 [Terracidiphilus sp.]|nr:hypothetical protein [Terracidiphilus sp.]